MLASAHSMACPAQSRYVEWCTSMCLLMQAASCVCDPVAVNLTSQAAVCDAMQNEPSKAVCAVDVAVEKVCRPYGMNHSRLRCVSERGYGCCQLALGCLCSSC
jgi:hypothetical protein